MREAVIIDAVRTPVGRYGGALKNVRSDDLAALCIAEIVKRSKLDPNVIEDVILGCTNQAGEDNRNVGRMAVLLAGLPYSVAGQTINRLCGSALNAVNSAAQAMVDTVVKEFGRVDILVNNAGVNRDAVIWKMTEEQWDEALAINLKGYFNYIRAVAPLFKDQGSGKIVNVTSINGIRGKFGQSNYTAAKAGIIGLTKTVARELARFNVNCNAVAPGLIETEMMKTAPEEVKQKALAEIVLGRLGTPEEVAWLVSFLCTEKARHITGEVIKVDGGQYI